MKNARCPSHYSAYHAHVYFDATTEQQAKSLCARAGEEAGITVGRFHTRLVGPHPHWSCQLSFSHAHFDNVMTWLERYRAGLSILVHGVTGDNLADHTDHASWLGQPTTLRLEVFTHDHHPPD